MQIAKFVIPEIIFGCGAIEHVGQAVARLGATRPLVVCDPGVAAAGWLDQLLPLLTAQQLQYAVWSAFSSNPRDSEVEAGAVAYRQHRCDALVALGGGSGIDAAKAIAILSTNGGRIHAYEGIDRIARPLPPTVMVPTTAGSASDVSQFAAITDTERHAKMTLISRSLVPDISITDPLLLTTAGPYVTACSGMDALTHGIEAYLSRAATFLTDQHALIAIQLVARHLRAVVAPRDDRAAIEAVARGSLHAGLAASNAILGAAHAMAHQVGGLLGQTHGELNAIILPYVMEFNLSARPERFAAIAAALGIETAGSSIADAGHAAIAAVRALARDVGLTRRLADLGMTAEMIPALSERALHDACMVTNPRAATAADLAALFKAAL